MARKNKYKKPEVSPWMFVGVITFIVAIIGLILILTPSEKSLFYKNYTENLAFQEEYKEDFKKNVFKKISVKNVSKKAEKNEMFFLYIGSPRDAESAEYIGEYDHYFKELELKGNIFYIDLVGDDESVKTLNSLGVNYTTENIGEILPIIVFFGKEGKVSQFGYPKADETTEEYFLRIKDYIAKYQ